MSGRSSPRAKYYRGSTDGRRPLGHDPLAKVRAAYDVVVIGSGLAGLTAANVLGKLGHRVALFEQHYNFGGLATWFKRRGGHVFDISLHGFPVGMIKTCRRHWTLEIAQRIVRLDSIRFDNPQFRFETAFTRADFTEKLVGVFGAERSRVEEFFAHLRAMNFYDANRETVAEVFERFFPGRNDIHRLLLEPIAYANGSALDDPAIAYGIVFSNFMSSGVYTFSGGTDLLVGLMRAELERNRVELFSNAEVERILVENGAAVGVVVGGREVRAGAVLSNASLGTTVQRLVGPGHFEASFAQGVSAVRLNNSSCQVYMGLTEGATIPFVTDLLFSSSRERFDSRSLCDFHGESRTFSFYYPKTRPQSERYAVVSSTNANWGDWAGLSQEQYEREKAKLAADTLRELERHVPGVTSKLDHVEVATPRTFGFYTQHPEGTSFGTKFEGLEYSLKLHEQVRGLFHAGSVGIIMSGWLGAANYGVIAAAKLDPYLAGLATLAAAKGR
ncbi:MAG: NAD(P)/FAD-dependent oxidoreductase [Planctomycetes bacterium]|nr:NAD(P)/FAD-dependent oxidoreductase [Planctomycetota bacterium]